MPPLPPLGLGTWQADPGVVGEAVKAAIECGYRLIDCAAVYGNEPEIGRALAQVLRKGQLRRQDLTIVSKLFNTHHAIDGQDRPREALQQTLADLQLDHVDVYLMHWPFAFASQQMPAWLRDAEGRPNPDLGTRVEFLDTYRSMQRLQDEGFVRSIGVSNFTQAQLEELKTAGCRTPDILQIELHLYLQQKELLKYCRQHGIQVMAYSPLGSKEPYSGASYPVDIGTTLLANPTVGAIANKHQCTPAQVLVRWSIDIGAVPIPKSASAARIQQNYESLQVKLDEDDMTQLASLDRDFRYSIGYMPGHYDGPNSPW